MTEEVVVDMKWETAVPLLLEIIQNGTPFGRRNAREELLRCARIADTAVVAAKAASPAPTEA
jgi:hypothetical protein